MAVKYRRSRNGSRDARVEGLIWINSGFN
jgi:hypothetical protein